MTAENPPQMKKTLSLAGLTINGMALIAPGAFMWLTYQIQASQVDPSGVSTAPDIWTGLLLATILCFFTAASYAWLSRRYPDAGSGSSYYFAQRALLDRGSSNKTARNAKFVVGWLSHLYYWVYPGVMCAMMGVFITYILSFAGIVLPGITEISFVAVFALLVGFIAYLGITGSTRTNLIVNVAQIVMLVSITGVALAYRFINPDHLQFYFKSPINVLIPSSASHMLYQGTIAILCLVGFESVTALTAEAKNPKDVPKAIIISLIIQGAFCYLLEYYGMQAWINSKYTFGAAALSASPVGDMVIRSVNGVFGGGGFLIMIVVAAVVAAAILGTTLSCVNTAVRVTYAISKDSEVPEPLGKLNLRHGTPAISIWVLTLATIAIGAFGVLSVSNLSAITYLSNFGTFMLYGVTCLIAVYALSREKRSFLSKYVIPIAGLATNGLMLATVLGLAIIGGSSTEQPVTIAIAAVAVWMVVGLGYFALNSRSKESKLLPFPGGK